MHNNAAATSSVSAPELAAPRPVARASIRLVDDSDTAAARTIAAFGALGHGADRATAFDRTVAFYAATGAAWTRALSHG